MISRLFMLRDVDCQCGKNMRKNAVKKTRSKVVAIVPAYNEEKFIARTIKSLYDQTYPLRYIWVIVNNCTDGTLEICQELQKVYGKKWLRICDVPENKELKAGAMNVGFNLVNADSKIDYVLGMDSDTLLEERIIETAMMQFKLEPDTGGICAAYRTLKLDQIIPDQKPTWSQKLLWYWQNIEFSLANAWRVENYKNARVLPGVASVFRVKALRDVMKINVRRGFGKCVWYPRCQVEDYLLTLDLKECKRRGGGRGRGWAVKSSIDMVAWSDVPISFGGLWRQRERWYSGTVDVIRPRLFKKHSRYEVFSIGLLPINLVFRLLLIAGYISVLMSNHDISLVTPFLVLPVATIIMQLVRLRKYGDNLNVAQVLMTISLIPNEIYSAWKEAMYMYSIWVSFRHPNREWAI